MMQEDEIIYEAEGVIEETSPEVINVDIFEAFQAPIVSDEFNHALLTNREIHDAHPITAITGLREELNSIEALQTVYSDKKGNADYYEWADGNYGNDNRIGFFVTLDTEERKISVCTGDDIFGVVVDGAGFVGGQDDITRDARYGLVMTSGVADVRCELGIVDGDCVTSNRYGVATKSSSNCGYRVVALHEIDGEPYATIKLNITADQVDLMGDELESLGSRMDAAETNIVSAINVANEAYKKSLEAVISSSVSEETIKDALESVQNSEQKIEEFEQIIGSSNSTAIRANAIAESAVTAAVSMREEAIANANETWAKIDELTDDIIEVDDKTDKAMHAIVRNGRILQSLTTVIAKYSVGEYSQANGLTLEQAENILEPGMMYVPTSHENLQAGTRRHTETYENDVDAPTSPRTFIPGYLYQWGKIGDHYGWITVDKNNDPIKYDETAEENILNTAGCAVYFQSRFVPSIASNSQYGYWYTDGDTSTGSASDYEPYALYKWEQPEGEEGYWFVVATLAGNVSNRATSQVRQTANEIAAEITNAYGSVAGFGAKLTDTESALQTLSAWKNGDGEVGQAIIRQEAKADGTASIVISTLQTNSDDEIESAASLVLSAKKNSTGTDAFLAIDADNINFESDNFTVKAKNIDFTGDDFSIDADRIKMTGTTTFLSADDVGANGTTEIDGARIITGMIKSKGYKSNDDDGYTTGGTYFNLEIGDINSEQFRIDGKTGDAYFKGILSAPSGGIGGWYITDSAISSALNADGTIPDDATLINSDNSIEYNSILTSGTQSAVRFSAGGNITTPQCTKSITRQFIVELSEFGMTTNTISVDINGTLSSVSLKKIEYYRAGAGYFHIYGQVTSIDQTNKTFVITHNQPVYDKWDGDILRVTYECTYNKTIAASTAPAFRVLHDGSLYASAANIEGRIKVNEGSIGNYTIDLDGSIKSEDSSFEVSASGDLAARNARIYGSLNVAGGGYFGNWSLVGDDLIHIQERSSTMFWANWNTTVKLGKNGINVLTEVSSLMSENVQWDDSKHSPVENSCYWQDLCKAVNYVMDNQTVLTRMINYFTNTGSLD